MAEIGPYYFVQGVAAAFFAIVGFLNLRHKDNRLKQVLGAIMIFWLLQHLLSVWFSPDYLDNRDYSTLINIVDMTAVPTCTFLLFELTSPGWVTWRRVCLHELPFVGFAVAYAIRPFEWLYAVSLGYAVAYGLVVAVLGIGYIGRYNRFLREHYSYDDNINLRWLRLVVCVFLVLLAIWVMCCTYNSAVGDSIYILLSIAAWIMISYFIHRQESVIDELEGSAIDELGASAIEGSDAQVPELVEVVPDKFDALLKKNFVEPQLYLNPQLKLGDLAAVVGTNRTYLSRYFNTTLNITFFEYVNRLRLDHAVKLMEEGRETITTIAIMSGFNSYATFRRAFYGRFNCSPNEYKQSKKPTALDSAE